MENIIEIDGIKIYIERKKNKNINIYVNTSTSFVKVTAPLKATQESILLFIKNKLNWIKKHTKNNAAIPFIREYKTDEIFYLWGEKYKLICQKNSKNFVIKDDNNKIIYLNIKNENSLKLKEKIVFNFFKNELLKVIPNRLNYWQNKTGLYCNSYEIKNIKTYWGKCFVQDKKIVFNAKIAERNLTCLDYIIVHELGHLQIQNHGNEFKSYMNAYILFWKNIDKILKEKLLYTVN